MSKQGVLYSAMVGHIPFLPHMAIISRWIWICQCISAVESDSVSSALESASVFICSSSHGNFTSQGLDQIGISTQERWWGISHLYPSIRTLLFYKCILQILSALSKHSSPAPLRGYSDVFNYSRNALSVLLGLSSWPQVTVLLYYYDFTLQSRWVLDLVNYYSQELG